MSAPEFSRPIDVRQTQGLVPHLVADAAERAALATRFALVRIDRLEADLVLARKDRAVEATGTLSAAYVQPCAVSGEDVPVTVAEVELDESELDEIEYTGTHFDLGEAVAQSLALAIDPYLTGPQADEARRRAGLLDESDAGPFAALKALKKD